MASRSAAMVRPPPAVSTSHLAVEARTRAWLEAQYERAVASLKARTPDDEVYEADGRPRRLSPFHFQELLRKLRIFRWLDGVSFSSFIDVGSGFDVYPERVGERYGVPAFYSDMVHPMNLPYGGSGFGRLDHAVTLNLASLPFRDEAFDVVLASEVLEHLVRPVEAIAELLRITRRMLVMTSLEALSVDRWQRLLSHLRVDVRVPHVERNFLLLEEIEAIFGPTLRHENLFCDRTLPASVFAPVARQEAAYGALTDVSALTAALCRAVGDGGHGAGTLGVLVVCPKPGVEVRPPRAEDDAARARWLVERTAAFHHALADLHRAMAEGGAGFPACERPVDPALRDRLRCPDCRRGGLDADGSGLRCRECGARFAGEYGVPILTPSRERAADVALGEALDRLCGTDASRRRTVARVARRLRRNERPPGAARRALWRLLPTG